MKKVLKLGIMLVGLCLLAGCFFKPQITKEQQNNVATRIVRNYDVQEIEFVYFDKNQSTGSYELVLKLNNDENKKTIISIREMEFFDKSEGELFLNPLGRFKDLNRKEIITGEVDLSSVKIKYLGEK
ncbi:hypothetical protein O3796_08910 [Granulicatella adiacens]|uniref:hypothetical protein n=1 Tax=Granulicatella adiacens TaxID=46124 RepID=UPI00352F54F5